MNLCVTGCTRYLGEDLGDGSVISFRSRWLAGSRGRDSRTSDLLSMLRISFISFIGMVAQIDGSGTQRDMEDEERRFVSLGWAFPSPIRYSAAKCLALA
jgi:hypothetical protein